MPLYQLEEFKFILIINYFNNIGVVVLWILQRYATHYGTFVILVVIYPQQHLLGDGRRNRLAYKNVL